VNFTFKSYALSLLCSSGTREIVSFFWQYRSWFQRETKETGEGATERSEFHERALLEFYFRISTLNLPSSPSFPTSLSTASTNIAPLQESEPENVIQSSNRTRWMDIHRVVMFFNIHFIVMKTTFLK
jgi:hypothetical protein